VEQIRETILKNEVRELEKEGEICKRPSQVYFGVFVFSFVALTIKLRHLLAIVQRSKSARKCHATTSELRF
jgi:hypothetical protein